MDRNTLLAFVLSMAIFTVWLMYQSGRQEEMGDASRQGLQSSSEAFDTTRQMEAAAGEPELGRQAAGPRDTLPSPAPAPLPSGSQHPLWEGRIEAERYTAELSSLGGGLRGWTLSNYFAVARRGSMGEREPIRLINPPASHPVALRTRFRDLGLGDFGEDVYRVVEQGRDRVVFELERGGVTIRKTYEFDLAGYEVDLTIEVHNGSGHVIAPDFAIEWPTRMVEGNDFREQSLVALNGDDVEREAVPSVGSPGFFSRFFGGSGDDDGVFRSVVWAGVDVSYFAAVLVPEGGRNAEAFFEPIESGKSAAAIVRFAPVEIAPGQSLTRRVEGYLGPKRQALLEEFGHDLMRSINLGYSWIEPLTLFFHWLLTFFYAWIPNYGVVIIVITILVRIATLPILSRQMRSMEKMRAVQPKMKEIQAEHSDDRAKQSEAMMAMYKEEGVNPLGGCLPMILQFPVFIGLFFSLQSSFELRQAPFVGWINDLSAPETLFMLPGLDFPVRLLPVIMGASMILQQKLQPTTIDPAQARMMLIMMPAMMTVLFYQFPSGLVLYWMISNFLAIGHQLFVGRRMRAGGET